LTGFQFLLFSGYDFCNVGPLAGVKKQLANHHCGCMHVG
jgi:hypothetical protein